MVKFLLPLKVLRVRDINSSNHIEAAAENTLNIAFNSLFTSHGSFSLSNAGCSSYIYIYIYIYIICIICIIFLDQIINLDLGSWEWRTSDV